MAPPFPTEEWIAGVLNVVISTSRYVIDVLAGGIRLLRKPLSFLFFLWLLLQIIGYVSSTFAKTFKPLCILPGIRGSTLCHTDSTFPKSKGSTASPRWADYPGLMNAQSLTFEQLLDDSVGGSGLSLDIKKAEMATSDLIILVKFSKLTSKELLGTWVWDSAGTILISLILAESLTGFVEDARRAGRGLQRLGSRVGGAVDQYVVFPSLLCFSDLLLL